MSPSKINNPTSPRTSCFTNILQRVICNGSTPRQQSLPNQVTKRTSKINPVPLNSRSVIPNSATDVVENKTRVRTQVVAEAEAEAKAEVHTTPGIVARLMGLDTLPPGSHNDSLFRSRSLNSLYILPDFDPARASFHRRARTSASFHEQGHNTLFKIDENSEPNCRKREEPEKVRKDSKRVKEKREDLVIMKGNETRKSRKKEGRIKKRYDEGYATTRKKNNVCSSSISLSEKNAIMQKRNLGEKRVNKNVIVGSTVSSKRKVECHHKEDPNVELQSDAQSRSPVSVLDDLCQEFKSPSKEDRRQVNSSLRRKSSRKIKISEDMLQQGVVPKSKNKEQSSQKISFKDKPTKIDGAVTEYFADLMGRISKLAEENIRDCRWNKNSELIKVHCVEEMCIDFSHELFDALLDELILELIVSAI